MSDVADAPIRVTLPAKVANNLDLLQEAFVSIAERKGCNTCFSGCNPLYLQTEREFVVEDEDRPRPAPWDNPEPSPWDRPRPSPWITASGGVKSIDVFAPKSVSDDIEQLKGAIAVVVGRLGCVACCSGFDITFRQESEFIAVDEQLEVYTRGD
jgi:hypothetical protein